MPTPVPQRIQLMLKVTHLLRQLPPTTRMRTSTWMTFTAKQTPIPQKPSTCSTERPREGGADSQGAPFADSVADSRSSCAKEKAKARAIGKARARASCTPKKTCRRSSPKAEAKADPVSLERAKDAERIRWAATVTSCAAVFVTATNIFNESVPTTPAEEEKAGRANHQRSCPSLPSHPPEASAPTGKAQALARRGATTMTMTSSCIRARSS